MVTQGTELANTTMRARSTYSTPGYSWFRLRFTRMNVPAAPLHTVVASQCDYGLVGLPEQSKPKCPIIKQDATHSWSTICSSVSFRRVTVTCHHISIALYGIPSIHSVQADTLSQRYTDDVVMRLPVKEKYSCLVGESVNYSTWVCEPNFVLIHFPAKSSSTRLQGDEGGEEGGVRIPINSTP